MFQWPSWSCWAVRIAEKQAHLHVEEIANLEQATSSNQFHSNQKDEQNMSVESAVVSEPGDADFAGDASAAAGLCLRKIAAKIDHARTRCLAVISSAEAEAALCADTFTSTDCKFKLRDSLAVKGLWVLPQELLENVKDALTILDCHRLFLQSGLVGTQLEECVDNLFCQILSCCNNTSPGMLMVLLPPMVLSHVIEMRVGKLMTDATFQVVRVILHYEERIPWAESGYGVMLLGMQARSSREGFARMCCW